MKALIACLVFGIIPAVSTAGEPQVSSQSSPFERKASAFLSQNAVIPYWFSDSAGTGWTLVPLSEGGRSMQLLINETIITPLRGRRITAINFRLPSFVGTAWPSTAITASEYSIFFGRGVHPGIQNRTYSENVVGPLTRVRSGSLTITPYAYPAGSTPNGWGPDISVTPWTYTDGHLLIEIRHSGFSSSGMGSQSVGALTVYTAGYGMSFNGLWGAETDTAGTPSQFPIIRLKTEDVTDVEVGDEPIPAEYVLHQNYPNPFNSSSTIRFGLPHSAFVSLDLFDMVGRKVETLVHEERAAGHYSVRVNAGGLASGVYLYTFTAGNALQTRKLVLIR